MISRTKQATHFFKSMQKQQGVQVMKNNQLSKSLSNSPFHTPTKKQPAFFSTQQSTPTTGELTEKLNNLSEKEVANVQSLSYQEQNQLINMAIPEWEQKLIKAYIQAARFQHITKGLTQNSPVFDYLDKALAIAKEGTELYALAQKTKLSMEREIGRGDQAWASVTDPKELAKLMDIPPESESDQEQEDEQDPNAPCTLTFK